MELFDDIIMLEFQEKEYQEFQERGRIVIPDKVKERMAGGEQKQGVSQHFFKVTGTGPDCKKVKIGDRIFLKPPTATCPGIMQAINIFPEGEKQVRFIIREQDVAGIE